MLGVSLTVLVIAALGMVVLTTTWRRTADGGGGKRRGGARAVLAVLTLAVPGIVLAAATPQATAAPQAPAQHARAQHSPAPAHPGPHDPPAPPAPGGHNAHEHTATVRIGPLPLPPYMGQMGHEGEHGGHDGQMATYVQPKFDLPCRDCYITGIQPNLVYADGSEANYHSGAMLHHAVVFDPSKTDTTCGRQGVGLLTGERIFASGNERTGAHLPTGYGYHLGSTPVGVLTELMNMSEKPQQVYFTLQVTWVDAKDAQLKEVTPVWLDVANCGNSQYSIPAGPSHKNWTWKSTLTGDLVTAAGHVHDHGISITLSNATRHETICRSVAGYGSGSHHGGHVESMGTCVGDPVATIHKGDDLVLDSYYDSPMPDDTVMGIMLAYVHQF